MTNLLLAMAAIGTTAAWVLSWRVFLPLVALVFLTCALSAAIWGDAAVFFRGIAALVTAQIGYVVGGVVSIAWQGRRMARGAIFERSARRRGD